jgi:hypothetical protein
MLSRAIPALRTSAAAILSGIDALSNILGWNAGLSLTYMRSVMELCPGWPAGAANRLQCRRALPVRRWRRSSSAVMRPANRSGWNHHRGVCQGPEASFVRALRPHMARLVKEGEATTLQDAYDLSLIQHPELAVLTNGESTQSQDQAKKTAAADRPSCEGYSRTSGAGIECASEVTR